MYIPNNATIIKLTHATGEIHKSGEVTAPLDLLLVWGESEKQWPVSQATAAYAELAEHRCSYTVEQGFHGELISAEEWALEFFQEDEEGEEEPTGSMEPAEEDEHARWADIPAYLKK